MIALGHRRLAATAHLRRWQGRGSTVQASLASPEHRRGLLVANHDGVAQRWAGEVVRVAARSFRARSRFLQGVKRADGVFGVLSLLRRPRRHEGVVAKDAVPHLIIVQVCAHEVLPAWMVLRMLLLFSMPMLTLDPVRGCTSLACVLLPASRHATPRYVPLGQRLGSARGIDGAPDRPS